MEESIWKKVLTGLERQGEGVRDEDFDDGIEEDAEEEPEEEGVGDVEYVSDLDEEEDEDMEELQEWLDGDRPNEAESEVSGGDVEDDGVSSHSGEEESADEQDFTTSRKSNAGSKRKRGGPTQKPRKKGPLTKIEYEVETIAPSREAVHA